MSPAKVLFSEFDVIRNDLTLHLRSLNLAEVDKQIPNRPEQRDWRWLDNFMASLHGLIRKNYPTVSLTQ